MAATMVGASDGAQTFEIARADVFRLKPSTVQEKRLVATVERPQVTLPELNTLLGRPQVLLGVQSRLATEIGGRSCILAAGESRVGVTLLEINVKHGMVRIDNVGLEQVLMLDR